MLVVIFKAKLTACGHESNQLVEKLRKLAFSKFNCVKFESICEKDEEISLSYWQNEQDIYNWRIDAEHLIAQELGKLKFYSSYSVEVAEIKRSYSFKH